MGDRCRGGCCRRFTLPDSLDWFDKRIREEAEWEASMQPGEARLSRRAFLYELRTIRAMVVPLGESKLDPLLGYGPEWGGSAQVHYGCRHLDPESGNCTIYDYRPRMCRDYPGYGNLEKSRCRVPSCSSTEFRRELLPPAMPEVKPGVVCDHKTGSRRKYRIVRFPDLDTSPNQIGTFLDDVKERLGVPTTTGET